MSGGTTKIRLLYQELTLMDEIKANRESGYFLKSLAIPSVLWCLFFVLGPLSFVFVFAFLTRGTYGGIEWVFTFDNFTRAFDWIYVRILIESVKIALGSSVLCVIIAFPIAWMMSQSKPETKKLILALLLLPFLVNCVLRTTAIKAILQGVESNFPGGIAFSSDFKVWIGMITAYLPFAVLPIYVSLEKFDFTILEAARDLGAAPVSRFVKILFPLIKPGLVTAFTLVFIPALCEFLLPDFLGGAKNMLIGGLISKQFLDARDWPFGSALSVILIAIILGVILLEGLILRKSRGHFSENLSP